MSFEHLKRNINKTNFYDSLIKKGSCNITNVDYGTTKKTLELLQEASYLYKNQTKQLANHLKTKNLEKTINNIQNFLYNNFQYKADEDIQYINSPSCAYSKRFTGIDCKSYTTIASTILLNLEIPHFLKRVKYINDTDYSHVYITISKNLNQPQNLKNGYYIIDGTLKNPIENKKQIKNHKQLYMPTTLKHIGLNGQSQSQAQLVIDNFQNLLERLRFLQYSDLTINRFKDAVKSFTDRGYNPRLFKAKNNNGLYVENIFIPFLKKPQGLNGGFDFGGLGDFSAGVDLDFGGIGTISDLPPIGTIGGGGQTGGGFDLVSLFGNFQDTDNINDLITSGAIMGLDSVTGGLGSTVANLIGFDIGQAIDSILSGDFSCIGAAEINNDQEFQKIQTGVSNIMKELQQPGLTYQGIATIFTKANYFLNHVKTHQLFHKSESRARCSKEKNQAQADFATELLGQLDETIQGFRDNEYTVNTRPQTRPAQPNLFDLSQYTNKSLNHWKGQNKTVWYTEYQVYKEASQQQDNNQGNNNQDNQDNNNQDNQDTKKTNTTALVLGSIVAGSLIKGFLLS